MLLLGMNNVDVCLEGQVTNQLWMLESLFDRCITVSPSFPWVQASVLMNSASWIRAAPTAISPTRGLYLACGIS